MKTRYKIEMGFYALILFLTLILGDRHYKAIARYIIYVDQPTMAFINISLVTIGMLFWFRIKAIYKK